MPCISSVVGGAGFYLWSHGATGALHHFVRSARVCFVAALRRLRSLHWQLLRDAGPGRPLALARGGLPGCGARPLRALGLSATDPVVPSLRTQTQCLQVLPRGIWLHPIPVRLLTGWAQWLRPHANVGKQSKEILAAAVNTLLLQWLRPHANVLKQSKEILR